MQQYDDIVRIEVSGWISKAENDLKNIMLVLPVEDAPYDTVCFHAQQAAEKYIKALLTYLSIPFGKSHDLPELLLLLPNDSKVPELVGDLSELADAAVTTRYPGDPDDYDRPITERLVEQAQLVKSVILSELDARGYLPKTDKYSSPCEAFSRVTDA